MLKASAVVNALAIVLTVYAVLAPKTDVSLLHLTTDNKFLLLCGAMALWGAAYGSWPIVDSLFADSVPTGARSPALRPQLRGMLSACGLSSVVKIEAN